METLQSVITAVLAFVVVLSIVVFVHEFGHFQAARWCGVAIKAFSIGFGKPLKSWTDKHGVEWRIGNLPLGGYVMFKDDANAASTGSVTEYDTPEARQEARRQGLFHAQPAGVRAFVTIAGPLANFLFAIVIFALAFMTIGRPVPGSDGPPRIDAVVQSMGGEPAPGAVAGFQPGDVVVQVDGTEVTSFNQFSRYVSARPGQPLQVTVTRAGQPLTLTVTPRAVTQMDPEKAKEVSVGRIGLSSAPIARKMERLGPIEAIGAGVDRTWNLIVVTVRYIGNIFTGQASPEHLAGPLGIAQQSGQLVQAAASDGPTGQAGVRGLPLGQMVLNVVSVLVLWMATLSVAIGFTNLLPIPVLDGGQLMLIAAEVARGGKPLSLNAREWAARVGLVLVGILFLFATWNDLRRIFLPEAS